MPDELPTSGLDALFTPDAQAAPAAPVADAPVTTAADAPPPATPPAAAQYSPEAFQSWYNKLHPEAPEGIVKIDDWRTARKAKETITRALFEKETALTERESELAAARADLAAAKAAGGSGLPEAEAVKALQAELAAERASKQAELKEWNERKAKDALEGNHAFLAEFDGKRASIQEQALQIAQEAGVSEDVVQAALAAGSKYQLAKALEGVTDAAANKLLSELGGDFIKLTAEREAAMKNPVDNLKRWNDYSAELQGSMTRGFQQKAVDTWTGAVPNALKQLEGEPFFKTSLGQAQLGELQASISSGRLPTVEQSIASLAKAQAADFYREAYMQSRGEITALREKLAKFSEADPAVAARGLPPAHAPTSDYNPERGW